MRKWEWICRVFFVLDFFFILLHISLDFFVDCIHTSSNSCASSLLLLLVFFYCHQFLLEYIVRISHKPDFSFAVRYLHRSFSHELTPFLRLILLLLLLQFLHLTIKFFCFFLWVEKKCCSFENCIFTCVCTPCNPCVLYIVQCSAMQWMWFNYMCTHRNK